ncbi:MAG: hypothetical protein LWY06_09295 [Firmicutes bacterium]|nr:hypothetical protein [Bacillota bacterium]
MKTRFGKIELICLAVIFTLFLFSLAGCSGNSSDVGGTASDTGINMVFVVTQDLEHNGGDISTTTSNLNNRGLQRALLLAGYLKSNILGSANPNGIYALSPYTHLQTENNYPDMVPLEVIEQFALLNQYTLSSQNLTAQSFPVFTSYTANSLPSGCYTPPVYYPECQGIDFNNNNNGNVTLLRNIIAANKEGYYVFAMPFDTFHTMAAGLKEANGYEYEVPGYWEGPNKFYMINIPSGSSRAILSGYNSGIEPGTAFPAPSVPYTEAPCQQKAFYYNTANISGAKIPDGINTNQTLYFVRHGEAHPSAQFENGNLVMQGNWRALYIPQAIEGKIKNPDYIYTVDPAQFLKGMPASGQTTDMYYSYVRPSMTIAPYAISKDMPINLAYGFNYCDPAQGKMGPQVDAAIKFFFSGSNFSNKTLIVDWEHVHIQEISQLLLAKYFENTSDVPVLPNWPGTDYDTIWTITLDNDGNLTISNSIYQGIESSSLPSTAPTFNK